MGIRRRARNDEGSRRGRRLTLTTRMILRNLERQPMRSLMSITGIAFATAVLFVGLAFLDVMNALIDQQFSVFHVGCRLCIESALQHRLDTPVRARVGC